MTTGLSTGLKPKIVFDTSKHGSGKIEVFLTAVGKTLLGEAFRRQRFERLNKKIREIYDVLQKLNNSGSVYVLTNKTNSTRVI